MEKKYIKLKGSLEHTCSSLEIKEDGSLIVDFYDFSQEAEDHMGGDVAYSLIIDAADKEKIFLLLLEKSALSKNQDDKDGLLLAVMEKKFRSYFEVQEWLKNNGIAFKKVFDPWP
jgi:hypothetical protein